MMSTSTLPSSGDKPAIRLAVVAPTFNNAATLGAVLDAVAACDFAGIIVVNDGSTDETRERLDAWRTLGGERVVIHHPNNRGKADALTSGFVAARERGFTHALTIDTDGQHDVADAVRLRDCSENLPTAIIVGCRPCGRGYPLLSRAGRAVSNLMLRLIAGASVGDSQCGLRVYPLNIVEVLGTGADRYAFETEVLVRAAWANVPIVEVAVQCIYDVPAGRVTHFRVLRDSLSAAAMHVRLLTRSLCPWPTKRLAPIADDADAPGTIFDRGRRWLNPFRTWRQLRRNAHERERLGASIGWGLFIGTQPPLGYKGALCLLLAKVFRLQPLIVLATSSLSTPPLGFVLWGSAIITGHLLLHGSMPSPSTYDWSQHGPLAVVRAVALEWIVGGIVFGSMLGMFVWLVTTAIVRGLSQPADAITSAHPSAADRAA